jgi:nitrogen-specific signal transduction histidine kinase
MKLDIPAPTEKLAWFQEKLALTTNDVERITRYRAVFLKRKEDFAEKLCSYFCEIPETRIMLQAERRKDRLKKVWIQWYDLLFQGKLDESFYARIWRSGLRHVELNIDKSLINLAYSVVRQYYQEVARSEIPHKDHEPFLTAMDKILDFCVLVETHAYVSATSQCDMEVVRGISHQVRNPLTVIGGNILRLKRNLAPDSPMHKTYETILMENKRLEAMVRDVAIYSELSEKEAVFKEISLQEAISKALRRLVDSPEKEKVRIVIELDPRYPLILGDANDIDVMFYYLLQNSFEALDRKDPALRITSKSLDAESAFLQIEIFNTGNPPDSHEIESVFVPFYSSKPYGTGFGLPIARLIARKNRGEIFLEPVPDQGTRCIIQLPIVLPEKSPQSYLTDGT